MRKNFLLSIDEELLQIAKKTGLDISRVAEDALRSYLGPVVSETSRQLDFEAHLRELEKQGRCYLLPFSLQKLKLENIGLFDDLTLQFDKGINLIWGLSDTGKTTIIKAIADLFDSGKTLGIRKYLKYNTNEGTIIANIYPEDGVIIRLRNRLDSIDTYKNINLIMLDEPVGLLNSDEKEAFIFWLKRRYNCQVIMTSRDEGFIPLVDRIVRLPLNLQKNDSTSEKNIRKMIEEKESRMRRLEKEMIRLRDEMEGLKDYEHWMTVLESAKIRKKKDDENGQKTQTKT
jgi:energy-coupling factor transporter ATP-binding protein EcfA2